MTERKEQTSPQSSPRTKFPGVNSSMSNNGSSIHEDENLISQKGLNKSPSTVGESRFKPTTPKEERPKKYSLQQETPLVFKPTQTLREKLSTLLKSKTVEIIVMGLIFLYMLLVFINILMETGVEEDVDMMNAIQGLKFAELGILSLFIVEIILKVAVFGVKGHFKHTWTIIDCMLVLTTFGMVIADVELEDASFNGISRVRAVFRLFRIFLIIRKSNDLTRVNLAKVGTSNLMFKSPVEKVLELFEAFKKCVNDKSLIQEIDWAIETVSANKLYEPIIEEGEGKDGKNEVGLWVKSYQTKDKVKADPKKTSQELARSMLAANITPKNSAFIIPIEAREILTKNVDLLAFDVMELKDVTVGQELSFTAMFLFERHNFFDALNIKQQTFLKFIRKVQAGYLPNPYHNSTHAADVLQSTNYFITTGEMLTKAQLTNLEVASLFIASAIHDYDHPGTNNAFHINTSSQYAIRYNDRGVLENHHVSSVFELLKDEELNIFSNFSKEDYKIIRERIIAMVLATDMSTHFGDVAKLKGRLAADFDIKDKDKKFMMELVVHAADISNPSKPWDTCREWTTRIVTEFFNQGDKERDIGLPITYLCDRYTVNTAKSQIGFIDFVVSPLFILVKEVLPKVDISHLETNKNKWKDLVEFYETDLKNVNERRKTTTETKEIAA